MIMAAIPRDFASALKAAGLTDFFAAFANSHQNEYLKSGYPKPSGLKPDKRASKKRYR